MAKIQITSVSVKKITYIGERHPCINISYQYVAVLIEGYTTDSGGQVRVDFVNCGCNTMIYDSFVGFAEDWRIDGDGDFDEPFVPPTSQSES